MGRVRKSLVLFLDECMCELSMDEQGYTVFCKCNVYGRIYVRGSDANATMCALCASSHRRVA
jgi:hypothetical protein